MTFSKNKKTIILISVVLVVILIASIWIYEREQQKREMQKRFDDMFPPISFEDEPSRKNPLVLIKGSTVVVERNESAIIQVGFYNRHEKGVYKISDLECFLPIRTINLTTQSEKKEVEHNEVETFNIHITTPNDETDHHVCKIHAKKIGEINEIKETLQFILKIEE